MKNIRVESSKSIKKENTSSESRHHTWSIIYYYYDESGTRHEQIVREHYSDTPSSEKVYTSAMKGEKIINIIVFSLIVLFSIFVTTLMFIYPE